MSHFRLGLLLATLLALSLTTGFRPFYLLFYALTAGVGLGYLWAWLQLRGLDVRVDRLNLYPQVGQSLPFRVTVWETLGLPRVGLRLQFTGEGVSTEETVINLTSGGTVTWAGELHPERRGPGTLGSVRAATSDFLGLVRLQRVLAEPHSVLILPRTVALPPGVPAQYRGLIEGSEFSRRARESVSVAKVREYVSGDSLRYVHWPSTARLGQLMTKEFDSGGEEEDVWMFLDMQADRHAGTGNLGTEEVSVVIAASLAQTLMESGKAVGLVAEGEVRHHVIPSREGGHLLNMMKTLAVVRAQGAIPLPELIAQESARLEQGTNVVLIAPWPGQGLSGIPAHLGRRAVDVLPVLLDAASFGQHQDARWVRDPRAEFPGGLCFIHLKDDPRESLRYVLDRLLL